MDKNKFYINFTYFVSMLSVIVVRIVFAVGVFDSADYYNRIFSLLVQIVAMGIIPFFLYFFYLKANKQSTPIKRLLSDFGYGVLPNKKAWLIALIISLLSSFIVVCVSSVWHGVLSLVGYNKGLSTGSAYFPRGKCFCLSCYLRRHCPRFLRSLPTGACFITDIAVRGRVK